MVSQQSLSESRNGMISQKEYFSVPQGTVCLFIQSLYSDLLCSSGSSIDKTWFHPLAAIVRCPVFTVSLALFCPSIYMS